MLSVLKWFCWHIVVEYGMGYISVSELMKAKFAKEYEVSEGVCNSLQENYKAPKGCVTENLEE